MNRAVIVIALACLTASGWLAFKASEYEYAGPYQLAVGHLQMPEPATDADTRNMYVFQSTPTPICCSPEDELARRRAALDATRLKTVMDLPEYESHLAAGWEPYKTDVVSNQNGAVELVYMRRSRMRILR